MGMKIKYLYLGSVATLLLVTSNSSGPRTVTAIGESPAAANSRGTRTDTTGEAAVSGIVKLAGSQPAATRIDMAADPACLKMHPAPMMSEEVVTGTNGALKNAIVYISDGLGNRTFDPPAQPVVFEQKGCTYNPHILGMRARQILKVANNDPTTHNIHPVPQNNRESNMSQPPGSSPIEETFAREEIIPVKCNVHPWMKGYIGVFKHPFFAVTDKNGSFELKNVPPGEYTIQAWHEKYGVLTQKVKLEANKSQEMEFVFKP
jgi:hypothetical protein